MKGKAIYHHLDRLFRRVPEKQITNKDRLVIFSDLHMGDGSSKDDFKRNARLFEAALKQYYYPKGYAVILNGDVLELQRFRFERIRKAWPNIFRLFDKFKMAHRFYQTVGNHDVELTLNGDPFTSDILEGLRLKKGDNQIFIFHGHQTQAKYEQYNRWVAWILRYVANPLRIGNYTVAHDSRKQYRVEKKVYHYAAYNSLVAIIGHTHRPLFESLTKEERLRYEIEQLCRKYVRAHQADQKQIKKEIKVHKKELKKLAKKGILNNKQRDSLYHSVFNIPCLFNSGCVIGKRGMTAIEIRDGNILLVHWFDKKISKKYMSKDGYTPKRLKDTDYFRMVINHDQLDYIFTRIKLLT